MHLHDYNFGSRRNFEIDRDSKSAFLSTLLEKNFNLIMSRSFSKKFLLESFPNKFSKKFGIGSNGMIICFY